jgi:DNA adenine methylase
VCPRPFLKWAGGKGQLLPELLRRVDEVPGFGRYHEPFVGGGALFFEMRRSGRLGRRPALLSDTNPNLVDAWLAVRDHVGALIELLREHRARHAALGATHYYQVRGRVPSEFVERAARVIYLNKTCFNGLFRENSKGEFNVPMGRYADPAICDEENLRACTSALEGVDLAVRPFESVLDFAAAGDLVYFDPPYDPVSATSSFTAYAAGSFGRAEQERLRDVFAALVRRGAHVLLSNSATEFVKSLYVEFPIAEVLATRAVNSKAERRGKIAEALVWSPARAG